MRVYNLHGRRDNIYKARIKILVNALGIEEFRRQVEAEWATSRRRRDRPAGRGTRAHRRLFRPAATDARRQPRCIDRGATARAIRRSTAGCGSTSLTHRVPGHAIVNISLKEPGKVPGDATADQMDAVADLAERFSHDEIRVTYQQNLVLPYVALSDLAAVYDGLVDAGLATANTELVTDIIACPGLDYCNLANARAIPIAQAIAKVFADPDKAEEIGPLRLNISGCINACGHHHAGNIGILGVDKKGTEHYQITLGGSPKDDAAVGDIVGPSFTAEAIARRHRNHRRDLSRIAPRPPRDVRRRPIAGSARRRSGHASTAPTPRAAIARFWRRKMSEPKPLLAPLRAATIAPRLWRLEGFVADPWRAVADDEPLPLAGYGIVTLARWRAEQPALVEQGLQVGVRVEPSEALDGASDHLERLGVIALNFPKFTDGRAYSTARRLREVDGFTGELRATGDVLLDQLPLMLRAGFDAFEIVNAATAAALDRSELPAVRNTYQRSTASAATLWRQRRRLDDFSTAAE